MHLPLYLAASLVDDLRRTCQPTSHGRIRVPCSALNAPVSISHLCSLSSSLFPVGRHKAGTVSQAAGHPVTRREVPLKSLRTRIRGIVRRMKYRDVCIHVPSLCSLCPRWHRSIATQLRDASRVRIRVKVEKDYELRRILPQARNYSPSSREKHLQRISLFSRQKNASTKIIRQFDLLVEYTFGIHCVLIENTQSFERFKCT